jgi:radical SAM protein with 4Fe4S-binding SPASM domain
LKIKASAADALQAVARRQKAPVTVTFEVTRRCNYECAHCYQEHGEQDELSTEEVKDVLRQLAEAGVLFLTLMGGEYFMRRDADEILRYAHELGFALRLKTTGHHISEKRADLLASLRPLQVEISVYGAKPAAHEHITRQPGSWKRSLRAAELLIARKVPVELKCPVMEDNVAELAALTELAASIGATYSFDPKITAIQDGDVTPVAMRMSGETLQRFYSEDFADFLDESYRDYDPQEPLRPLHHTPCKAGQQACAITPEGLVWPCNALPLEVGDLRKQRFAEIWADSEPLEEVRDLRWAKISECNRCELRSYCQRCHGMALIEEGDMQGPSLEACRHAVEVRKSLQERGMVPQSETVMPPTWDRVEKDGQHSRLSSESRGRRSRELRILA